MGIKMADYLVNTNTHEIYYFSRYVDSERYNEVNVAYTGYELEHN